MNLRTFAPPFAIGIVVGALLVVLARPATPPALEAPAQDHRTIAPGEPAPPLAEPVPAPAPLTPTPPAETGASTARATSTGTSPTATAGDRAIAHLIEAIPAPTLPTATARIEGTVKLAGGEPLAGVHLALRVSSVDEPAHGKRGPRETDPERRLEDRVRRAIARARLEQALNRESTSDAEGRFAFEGLAPGDYFITANLPGYAIEAGRRQVHTGDTVSLRAKAVARVDVTVVGPDGRPPKDAFVDSTSARHSDRAWVRDGVAHVDLPPGTHEIQAFSGDELASEKARVTVALGAPPESRTLTLRPRPGIRVRLPKRATEDAISDLSPRVKYAPLAQGAEPDPERFESGSETVSLGRGDPCFIPDLAPGLYMLALESRGGMGPIEVVEVGSGVTDVELHGVSIDRASSIALTAKDPQGAPLELVDVSLTLKVGSGSEGRGGDAVRQDDGTFLVPLDAKMLARWREDGSSTLDLTVSSEGFGSETLRVPRADAPAVAVQFETPAVLEVTVADYASSGLLGLLSLDLERPKEGEAEVRRHFSSGRSSKLGADGKETLGPVRPGNWEIVASVKIGRHDGVSALRVPVTLRSGANQTTIPFPILYPLTIHMGKVAAEVYLRSEEGGLWLNAQSGKDGCVRFDHLPAGTFTLSMSGAGPDSEMKVTLPGPSELVFVPEVHNALLVTVSGKGFLAEKGFQTGDLIIGLDGQLFESTPQMIAAVMGSVSKPEVQFTVDRGGQAFTIALPAARLVDEGSLGGRIRPAARK